MSFKVFTDAAGSYDTFEDDDKTTVGPANGVLQIERADGSRVLFSPFGGWLRVEMDPRAAGVY